MRVHVIVFLFEKVISKKEKSLKSRIIVAAGGSGGSYHVKGCNGGNFDSLNCFDSLKCQYSPSINGIKGGYGGNGDDSSLVPGNGGGGGYFGGRGGIGSRFFFDIESYKGCSGSSHYDQNYIKEPEYSINSNGGNGSLKITVKYLCMENCSDCNSNTSCSKCNNMEYLYMGQCYKDCPSGTYQNGEKCFQCPDSCKECDNPNQCTTCNDGYYFQKNKCKSCSKDCATCSLNKTNCTACNYPKSLHNSQCLDECPEGWFSNVNNTCELCSTNCKSCRRYDLCTSCNPGYFLNQSKCIKSKTKLLKLERKISNPYMLENFI